LGGGDKKGASVSIKILLKGMEDAVSWSSLAFLKTTIPEKDM
jgi:hypothetical protein